MVPGSDDLTRHAMNGMYRWWRHIYDATRAFYLFGRDELVSGLSITPQDNLCEIGCGTARNLIKIAKYSSAEKIYGIDISDEMLKTARRKIEKNNMGARIQLAQAAAATFNPHECFACLKGGFNKIIFSYVLSISPDWQRCIDRALAILPVEGEIHIADFGSERAHPAPIRVFMKKKLTMFHVYCDTGICSYLRELEARKAGRITLIREVRAGRACNIIFKKL